MLPKATTPWTPTEAAHLMRRAGFGGSPAEVARIHALGRVEAVEALLHPAENPSLAAPSWTRPERWREEGRERFEKMRELREAVPGMTEADREKARREANQQFQRTNRQRQAELAAWWFDRMRHSGSPLREKMVLFWHDHFATSAQKVRDAGLLFQQNELFRKHALGDFRQLTHAVLWDPAMMLYLDTQSSRKGKPNENFAREVMELFTLGEGNYTEQDIHEAARAFTGYKLDRRTGEVFHARRQWDGGEKTVFGKTANFDGDGLIDLLFEQDAAARHLPAKLWAYFVEDEPPAAVVKELGKTFRESGFRVDAVLREIFLSKVFYDPSVIRGQIKSPVQFLAQMCQELEIDGLPDAYFASVSLQLGQVLFMPPNVAGWDWGRAWINTNTLLSRYNVAGVVTTGSADGSADARGTRGGEEAEEMMMAGAEQGQGGRMLARLVQRSMRRWDGPDFETIAPRPLREDPEKLVDALVERFFQGDPGEKQRAAFIDYAQSKKGVIFTNHEVAELCHLMMSTPQYQLC
ncbi:DUF1800 domain-containing protein [Haloferula sargassicola]|uniref:DUF1800 domain-containing protein n=1 Tax=Haloferula sargassicola TaxID=490096 RepID=A0ABP9UN98_9BACT